MKDKEESAFPEPFVNDPHLSLNHTPGMSKRFYAATAILQGLISNPDSDEYSIGKDDVTDSLKNKVKFAYLMSDELLKQEHNEDTEG